VGQQKNPAFERLQDFFIPIIVGIEKINKKNLKVSQEYSE